MVGIQLERYFITIVFMKQRKAYRRGNFEPFESVIRAVLVISTYEWLGTDGLVAEMSGINEKKNK